MTSVIHEVNGWEEDDDFWGEPEDEDEDEMVFDCGVEGCLMPGEHFRSECHTAVDLLRQERSGKRCPDGDWVNDREPGGMECDDCGCIFISNEFRARCKVCHELQTETRCTDCGATAGDHKPACPSIDPEDIRRANTSTENAP